MQLIANIRDYAYKEALYINVRNAEGRIISNDDLKQLPYLPLSSQHYKEWKVRAQSYARLKKHLAKKGRCLNIIEIGCGNGWLSHALYKEGHKVTGVDLNIVELEQAEATFGQHEGLQWVYADVLKDKIGGNFDVALFSASIQYFPSISQIFAATLPLLRGGGEIHFYDSIFYTTAEIAAAQQRTIVYYTQLGFPEMANYYHHHSTEALKEAGLRKMKAGLFAPKQLLQWWILATS